jgi:hypothetical protein
MSFCFSGRGNVEGCGSGMRLLSEMLRHDHICCRCASWGIGRTAFQCFFLTD